MKCCECKYGEKVTMSFHGVGASSHAEDFWRDGYRCNHPENKRMHDILYGKTSIFFGKTSPHNCKLRREVWER